MNGDVYPDNPKRPSDWDLPNWSDNDREQDEPEVLTCPRCGAYHYADDSGTELCWKCRRA